MKLLYRITQPLSVLLLIVISIWAAVFYFTMVEEINDEVDDALETFSEQIIINKLQNKELPQNNQGSNNEYYIKPLDTLSDNLIQYKDTTIYYPDRNETEPARMLKTVFCDQTGKYFELTVLTPTFEKNDLKETILTWVVVLYTLLLVCIILVVALLLKRSIKPLHKLLRWIDNYKVGCTSNQPLVNQTNVTEFRKLNNAIQRFQQRSEEIFEQQKQFIGNASHEMQTPVAIAKNKLELFLDDDSLSENQQTEIVNILKTLEYISRLNRSLLLLTKIENDQFPDKHTMVINQLVKSLCANFEEIYAHKNLNVSITENDNLQLHISEQLCEILITNLLKNAFVHNIQNGSVTILINKNGIKCCNSGISTPLDEMHIFERFYQGSKREYSSGLGLPIVDSICRLEKLNISYKYAENLHCFSISK